MTTPDPEPTPIPFVFPSQDELTNAAAALHPRIGADPEASVHEVLRLRLHAWIAQNHFAGRPPAEIIAELNAPELDQWVLRGLTHRDRVRLYPDDATVDEETRKKFFQGSLDDARVYLHAKQSWADWKTTRTVLHAVRLRFLDIADQRKQAVAASLVDMEKTAQKIAPDAGSPAEELKNAIEILKRRKRPDGQKEYEEFLTERAVLSPSTESHTKSPESAKRRKVEYWNIPTSFLDALVCWRQKMKKEGGMKKLEKDLRARLGSHTPEDHGQ